MPPFFDAVVVGASISGLWTLHCLKRQGLHVLLVDACPDVGGSWQYHRYPGCGVDAEVPYYEYSEPQLWGEWNWHSKFPDQAEIQRYLSFVCDKLGLRPHLRLDTRVTAAHWIDETRSWNIRLDLDRLVTSRYFVSCAGYATKPYIPDFPGRATFKDAFHTSQWPDGLQYRDKRVGVVGTGASGVQLIEAIASDVKELVVFQRSPNLATPKRQQALTPQQCREMKVSYPAVFRQRRSRSGYAVTHTTKTFDHSMAERQRTWERLWRKGGSAPWRDNYVDLLTDGSASDAFYEFWLHKTRHRIGDSRTADILAPNRPPYPFGTRRPALESRYFEVFNQANVHLVDLQNEPITNVSPSGVRTTGTHYDVDILVFATGFDFITGAMLAMDVRGRHGRRLAGCWDVDIDGSGISTCFGLMSRGFPNMFFPMGPQAPTALGFTPHMAEIQAGWLSQCLSKMKADGHEVVEPTEGAETMWREEVERANHSTLYPQSESWYMGQNIEGRRKQPLCYVGGIDRYVNFLDCNVQEGFPGFDFA